MGIGASVFLIAIGAILAFAVDLSVSGLDLSTIGVILMVVGAIGLATSFLFWDRMGFGSTASRRSVRTDYVDDGVVVGTPRTAVRERTVVRDDQVL